MRIFLLCALLCACWPLTAQATLVGDSIYGELNFAVAGSTNFFDPANGYVPSPHTPTQPVVTVTESDTTYVEYRYSDGSAGRINLDLDIDADTITLREFLISATQPAVSVGGWEIWLSDLDFGGPGGVLPGATILSSNFVGLTVLATDHDIHISYAGGQDIPTLGDELSATISLAAVPEPGTALLLGLGLALLPGISAAPSSRRRLETRRRSTA